MASTDDEQEHFSDFEESLLPEPSGSRQHPVQPSSAQSQSSAKKKCRRLSAALSLVDEAADEEGNTYYYC